MAAVNNPAPSDLPPSGLGAGGAGLASVRPTGDKWGRTPVSEAVLLLEGVSKAFESTRAVTDVSLRVGAGEIVGVVGHNGAGKSTLMRVVAGLTSRDSGTVCLAGQVMPPDFTVMDARARGISIASQEILLCPQLPAFENVVVMNPELPWRNWRRMASEVMQRQLAAVFPGHAIDPNQRVSRLSLAQRQMIQIALATVELAHPLRLLILDEPTSALSAALSAELFQFLRSARAERGVSALLISHRMAEVLGNTDRTVVMRDGRVTADRNSAEISAGEVVGLMSDPSAVSPPAFHPARMSSQTTVGSDPEHLKLALVEVQALHWRKLRGVDLRVNRGEIVGLAGLEGHGQRDVLTAIWQARRPLLPTARLRRHVRLGGRLGFVTGDRQVRGLFPLWSVRENVSISLVGQLTRFGLVRPAAESALVRSWIDELGIKASLTSTVTQLSGGTQQKVLLARGLAPHPDLLLLEDPFRGVDVMTKIEAYALMRNEASTGRAFLWWTSENAELLECDRVYVLHDGLVVAELSGSELTEEKLIRASFGSQAGTANA